MIELNILGDFIKRPILDLVKFQIGLKFDRSYQTTNGEVFILIGESYAFRVESDLTSTVILEFINESEAVCTIIASGGSKGLCKIDWGAQGSNERSIAKKIIQMANEHGWAVKTLSGVIH